MSIQTRYVEGGVSVRVSGIHFCTALQKYLGHADTAASGRGMKRCIQLQKTQVDPTIRYTDLIWDTKWHSCIQNNSFQIPCKFQNSDFCISMNLVSINVSICILYRETCTVHKPDHRQCSILVLWRFWDRISVLTLTILTEIFIIFPQSTGKYWDSTSLTWRLLPSKSFPIHQVSYQLTLHSLDIDSTVITQMVHLRILSEVEENLKCRKFNTEINGLGSWNWTLHDEKS
jgi:hypothetical protein